MIVADASALVEFVLGGSRGREVEGHLLAEEDRIHAPALLDAEVVQALRRMARNDQLSMERATASIAILHDMPLSRHTLRLLLPRMWALRDNLTAYDAAYVALAEALGCPLLTCDARLAGAPGHRADVVVVS